MIILNHKTGDKFSLTFLVLFYAITQVPAKFSKGHNHAGLVPLVGTEHMHCIGMGSVVDVNPSSQMYTSTSPWK